MTATRSAARRRALHALLLVACCACVPPVAAQATPDGTLSGPALLAVLRAGGHVLYFRHAATDFGQNDERMTGYEDCALQRNLTDAGRAQARAIGRAIDRLGIPVGTVLASPFCRTMETARLAFGRATPTPEVRGGPASDAGGRYADLRRLLSTHVPAGTNRVIVSHGNPFRALVDAPYLAEGEAAVIAPGGPAGFQVVGRVAKDAWARLAPP